MHEWLLWVDKIEARLTALEAEIAEPHERLEKLESKLNEMVVAIYQRDAILHALRDALAEADEAAK